MTAGSHARPGRLARLWRRLSRRSPDVRDDRGRPVRWPASARIGESREDFWRRIERDHDQDYDDSSELSPDEWRADFDAAAERYMAADAAVTPEDWAAAMLRARYPHLFSPTWLRDQYADHARWACDIWSAIRAMKREVGLSQ